MATVAEMKAAILFITGKDLSNADLLEASTLYCESYGSQWVNPWDETDNPAEYAAWPTAAELADFMAARTRSHWQQRVWRAKKEEVGEANEANEAAAAQAAADKL